MFEHLDDPAPRDGLDRYGDVAAAAARRRKHVWYAAGGSTALVTAAVVVLLVALLQPNGHAKSLLITTPSPSPTPTMSQSSTPTPSTIPTPTQASRPSPTPSTTPSHAPIVVPTHRVSPKPTPSPTCSTIVWNCPDGKPGYSNGFTGCQQPQAPATSTSPSADLTMTLTLASTTLAPGKTTHAQVTITNTGTTTVSYSRSDSVMDAWLLDAQGRPVSADAFSDGIGNAIVTLAPNQTDSFQVNVNTYSCGDTSNDPPPPLAAGSYTATYAMRWSQQGQDQEHTWVPAGTHVTVTS